MVRVWTAPCSVVVLPSGGLDAQLHWEPASPAARPALSPLDNSRAFPWLARVQQESPVHFLHLAECRRDDVTHLVRSLQSRGDRALICVHDALEVVPKTQNRSDFVVRQAHIKILSLRTLARRPRCSPVSSECDEIATCAIWSASGHADAVRDRLLAGRVARSLVRDDVESATRAAQQQTGQPLTTDRPSPIAARSATSVANCARRSTYEEPVSGVARPPDGQDRFECRLLRDADWPVRRIDQYGPGGGGLVLGGPAAAGAAGVRSGSPSADRASGTQ